MSRFGFQIDPDVSGDNKNYAELEVKDDVKLKAALEDFYKNLDAKKPPLTGTGSGDQVKKPWKNDDELL